MSFIQNGMCAHQWETASPHSAWLLVLRWVLPLLARGLHALAGALAVAADAAEDVGAPRHGSAKATATPQSSRGGDTVGREVATCGKSMSCMEAMHGACAHSKAPAYLHLAHSGFRLSQYHMRRLPRR